MKNKQVKKNLSLKVVAKFSKKVQKTGCRKKTYEFLKQLKVEDPSFPYFYGLSKILKDGITLLRPLIISGLLFPFIGRFSDSYTKYTENFMKKIKDRHCHNVELLSHVIHSSQKSL